MNETDARVVELLDRAAAHLAAIRTPKNGSDREAERLAHETVAELFSLGMRDRWREEDGAEPPDPSNWDWNAEPLEPASDWAPETVARFHRVCGDLNLLHSNDAGLNAAMGNYEQAIPLLREIEPVSAVLCHARMLRAAAYASYGSKVLLRDVEGLAWAVETARTADAAVRDELELSVVEMSCRLLGRELWGLSRVDARRAEVFEALLRGLIGDLCARDELLAFRRSTPWLAVATWAPSRLFAGEHLTPLLSRTGAGDVPTLQLHAIERAEALEDGIFYPHGGALPPDEYVRATRERARRFRLEAFVELARPEAIDIADALLAELDASYQAPQRVELEALRLRAIEATGDMERWREAATTFVRWLEQRAGVYWWTFLRVPETLEALAQVAAAHSFDDLREAIARVARAG